MGPLIRARDDRPEPVTVYFGTEEDMTYLHMSADCADHHQLVRDFEGGPRPVITTLCGSTRFKSEFIQLTKELTLEGVIVISVGLFGHEEGLDMTGDVKSKLDELHLRKIDLSDMIFVINVDGYIGESTAREITYAYAHRKQVMYLEYEGEDVYAPRLAKPDGDYVLG